MNERVQLLSILVVMGLVVAVSLIQRFRLKQAEQGPFWPSNQEPPESYTWPEPVRPQMRGYLTPLFSFALYWASLLTFNNHFRKDTVKHGRFIDGYAIVTCGLAYAAAWFQLGRFVWIIVIWRISCLMIHVLSVGLFRNNIRKMRGDFAPTFSTRIVLLGLVNWGELVALFALLYQTIRGGGRWLFESFTTQVTMGHSTPVSEIEKLVVVSQISVSLCLLTTLIGMYVGSLYGGDK